MKIRQPALVVGILLVGMTAGVAIQRASIPHRVSLLVMGRRPVPQRTRRWTAPPKMERVEVGAEALRGRRVAVLLCLGQSNAGSHGGTPRSCTGPIYVWHEGRLTVAADPVPGTTGTKGSVWTRLGPRLLATGRYDAVVFVPVAVGGTSVEWWTPDSVLGPLIRDAIEGLGRNGLTPTAVLWQQGEYDADQGMTGAAYEACLRSIVAMIRSERVVAPVYVARATVVGGRLDPEIHAVQATFPGPDADAIGDDGRESDRTHFNDHGLDQLAEAWLGCLQTGGAASQ